MVERVDALIVGAGIAGSAVAFELAQDMPVVLLEREAQPGYHSTGRSAAMLSETYATPVLRALTRASRPFLERPPDGFTAGALLSPRGMLHIARADQRAALDAAHGEAGELAEVHLLDADAVLDLVPVLDRGYVAAGLYEPGAMAIDIGALHQGYLRGFARQGGRLATDAEITAIAGGDGAWRVETRAGAFEARVLVDAAGGWADELAAMAGRRPVGLVAKRRTAVLLDPPDGRDPSRWPMVMDIDETFYFKPEAGRLMLSPADATPTPPADVQPEDFDVALAVDRYERATGRTVERIVHRWAGLRSFVADEDPVVGPDPDDPSFVWLAALGGSGIMTAPALGRLTAGLITGGALPEGLSLDPERLGPARLARS